MVARFERHGASLAVDLVFGRIDKDDYAMLHVIRIADHLGAFSEAH